MANFQNVGCGHSKHQLSVNENTDGLFARMKTPTNFFSIFPAYQPYNVNLAPTEGAKSSEDSTNSGIVSAFAVFINECFLIQDRDNVRSASTSLTDS